MERDLFRVSGLPTALDRAEVQERLLDHGWPTSARHGFHQKNNQIWVDGAEVDLPTWQMFFKLGDEC